jgi:hypothetical protein
VDGVRHVLPDRPLVGPVDVGDDRLGASVSAVPVGSTTPSTSSSSRSASGAASHEKAYYDKKRAEGMTARAAMRCLKRRLVDITFRLCLAPAAEGPAAAA